MAEIPVIQTDKLTKIYRHQLFTWIIRARALQELTFDVKRGEVFGLLGPNGSGKTTTIKLLLGLVFPTSGEVSLFGRRPQDLDVKGRLGFLPEESYLYRFLDAEETLDFYGRLFKLPSAERRHRIETLLDLTGLRRERRRPIVEFSKGMQRRIGLAQALINDPELIILDEPTAGLDPIGTREVKDLVLQLKAKGKTVLLSSHLLGDVEDVCDRIAILYGGRLQAAGSVYSLLQQKSLTQITAEMDDATTQEVQSLIRKRHPNSEVRIEPPTERLEQFFLRVVQDAENKGIGTSGASTGKGTADFFSQVPAGGTLLERLSGGEDQPQQPAAPEPMAPSPEADRQVLGELTVKEKEKTSEAPSSQPPQTTAADDSLLKRLSEDSENET